MAEASPNKVFKDTADRSVKDTETVKNVDDEANTCGLMTHLLLAGLTSDKTKVLHPTKLTMTFLKNI